MTKIIQPVEIFLLVVFLWYICYLMIDRLGNENAEYYTMDEINHTIDFLENNHKWPFALGDLLSNESLVFGNYDFSISISDSGAAEILNSINVRTGKLLTNPHYQTGMASLYEQVMAIRGVLRGNSPSPKPPSPKPPSTPSNSSQNL